MILLISCSTFSDVLTAFTCAKAIGFHWSICLPLSILSSFPYFALHLALDSNKKILKKLKKKNL